MTFDNDWAVITFLFLAWLVWLFSQLSRGAPIKTQPLAKDQAYTFSSLIWGLAEIVFSFNTFIKILISIWTSTEKNFAKSKKKLELSRQGQFWITLDMGENVVTSTSHCIFMSPTRYFAINFIATAVLPFPQLPNDRQWSSFYDDHASDIRVFDFMRCLGLSNESLPICLHIYIPEPEA